AAYRTRGRRRRPCPPHQPAAGAGRAATVRVRARRAAPRSRRRIRRRARALPPLGRARAVGDARVRPHRTHRPGLAPDRGDRVSTDPTVRIDDGHRLVWRGGGETVVVEPWGRDSVRVRAALMRDVVDTDWALLPPASGAHDHVEIEHTDTGAVLANGDIRVELTTSAWFHEIVGHEVARCELAFTDADGRLLFRELPRGGSLNLQARQLRPRPGDDGVTLTASFESDPDEHLAGMGQYQQHVL